MRGAPYLRSCARRLRAAAVDVIHCHGGRDQVLALAVATLAGVPHLVRTKHNHTAPRGWRHRLAYRRCDRIVTVSDYVRDQLVAAGLSPARVVSIPTAVDIARFRPRPRDPALAASLGIAGRPRRRQRVEPALAQGHRGPAACASRLARGLHGVAWPSSARRARSGSRSRRSSASGPRVFPAFAMTCRSCCRSSTTRCRRTTRRWDGAIEAMAAGSTPSS
jgi:glycosyltransferase involved in cell wall biosynthesis